MGNFMLVIIALLLPAGTHAEMVLVVGQESPITRVSQRQAVDMYLGRSRALDAGLSAKPVDLPAGHLLRQRFYAALTGKSEAQVDAYWAQLVFAGRVTPIARVDDVEHMLDALQTNPEAVGYLERSSVPADTRVVCSIGDAR